MAAAEEKKPTQGCDNSATAGMLPAEFRTLVIFEVCGRFCALPTTTVKEVMLLPELSKPPGLFSLVEGILNLGGQVIPVLRLDRLFGLPEIRLGLYTPVLLLKGMGVPLALLVDQVTEVVEPGAGSFARKIKEDAFSKYLAGKVIHKDSTIHIIDPQKIILEGERRHFGNFHTLAQGRELPDALSAECGA